MRVYKLNHEMKSKEIIIDDIPVKGYDPPVLFEPNINNPDKEVIIKYGEQEFILNKNEIEIVFNRPGEVQDFNKYLMQMKVTSNKLRKYYKQCEIFFNNFKYDVSIISRIIHNEDGTVNIYAKGEDEINGTNRTDK